jgi:hypothetical protein
MRAALLLIAAIAFAGCAHGRSMPVGRSAAEIIIVVGAYAIAGAIEESESESIWCEEDVVDPPHTCPAVSGPTQR